MLPDIVAAFTLYWPLTGQPGGELGAGKLASNGFDGASPGKFGMGAAFVAEVLLTAMLLMIIMGSTHKLAAAGAAPIAIGLWRWSKAAWPCSSCGCLLGGIGYRTLLADND